MRQSILAAIILALLQGCVQHNIHVDVSMPNLEASSDRPLIIYIDTRTDDRDKPKFDTKLTPAGT